MNYKEELIKSMDFLANDSRTVFLGQGVLFPGHAMYETLKQISECQRMELPVVEDLQLGMSIGLSLSGYIPISIFPRMDFMMCCMNQLVNHLDKVEEMSQGQYKPFVIIRTMIGSANPLDPGPQHKGDYTEAFRLLTSKVEVLKLRIPEDIFKSYKWVYEQRRSAILIEMQQ